MSNINKRIATPIVTSVTGSIAQLQRLVLATLLFQDTFYMNGKTSGELIAAEVAKCDPQEVANLMKTARNEYKLRAVPLFLARELARLGKLKAQDLTDVIQRPDEIADFIALYWKEKKQPLSAQVRKGLADAFLKFNEYQLAKFGAKSGVVSLRDAMFLTHPKPANPTQVELFKKIASKTLEIPDTWETELSAGADKRATFIRLMDEKKLGALAFLRNLRGMKEAGVPEPKMREYLKSVNLEKVLPFRFLTAAQHAPSMKDALEVAMLSSLDGVQRLPGKTVLLVDISGSMFGPKVSAKSELDRFDAACAVAMIAREICENVSIYTFSNKTVKVKNERGFALKEALFKSQPAGGTDLGQAVRSINANESYDRVIVFTDEQSQSHVPAPKGKGYVLNVAGYQNGISTSGSWETVTGFSEASIAYIQALEAEQA
jgi:hypothetical protein